MADVCVSDSSVVLNYIIDDLLCHNITDEIEIIH